MLEVVVLPALCFGSALASGLSVMAGGEATARASRPRGPRCVWHPSRRAVEQFPSPCVYVVRRGGTDEVKIGYTARRAKDRIREWALTGMSEDAIVVALVVGGQELEAALHREFRRERIRMDREWFNLPAAEEPAWRARMERAWTS